MYVVVTVLIFIAAILLILIVLVQNSKGGGLAANFTSANQTLGVRKTTDFLEKATWVLAVSLLVLSIAASASIPKKTVSGAKGMLEEVDFSQQNSVQNIDQLQQSATETEAQPAETNPQPAE
ncbi:MAG: preprotein translocase subunit SecG [Bacteroidales bacterium]|nr:preprotein translocase subunit SecG [Bacteroidales bacterium]